MIRSRFLSLAALAVAVPAFAQQHRHAGRRSARHHCSSSPTRSRPRRLRRACRATSRRRSRSSTSAPPTSAASTSSSRRRKRVPLHRVQALLGRRLHAAVPGPTHQNTAAKPQGRQRQGRQPEPAHRRSAPGFNNAVANLYLNAQLARGIRVAVRPTPRRGTTRRRGSRTATS